VETAYTIHRIACQRITISGIQRQSSKQSPGGRDRFAGNAASYLEIGDAMAEAILKLQTRPSE
jgi:hypothetical protein